MTSIRIVVGNECRMASPIGTPTRPPSRYAAGPWGHQSRAGFISALSWPIDISWLAVDSDMSSGTPSVGGRSHKQSAPMAEKPKPDSPLISADAASMATSAAHSPGVIMIGIQTPWPGRRPAASSPDGVERRAEGGHVFHGADRDARDGRPDRPGSADLDALRVEGRVHVAGRPRLPVDHEHVGVRRQDLQATLLQVLERHRPRLLHLPPPGEDMVLR